MPRSALKLEFSFFCLCAGATSGYCAITVTQKVQSSCGYELQINEDNIALFGASGIAPGIPNSPCGCFDANPPKICRVNLEDFYKNKIELGRQTFKNKQGETCFLDNLSLGYTEQGCFSGSCRSFSGLSFSVSCEPPSSIPDKCGKSKAFAETVLLSDNAFKCDSLGGKFEGGVYPQKSPDGTDEYCVSGTCSNLCDSAWHKSVVKEIKDSVCCGRMRLEPQTGNGKCTEPKAMDSTKIGVNFPEVKLGCSVTPAGSGFNYCEVPSSSSSSSFEEALSSSSYENAESSSSGEGESDSEVDCFADIGMAASNLHSKIWQCEQEGGVSDFREYSGCVYGSCLPPSSSSSEEMSSSSEEQSSSGDGESGVCSDGTQFSQKSEADLYDDWVYEGETLYGYDTVLVAVNPRSGFYDILGRLVGTELADLEKRVKGFYIYKNRQPRKIFDIKPKTMPMYRKDYIDSDGDTVKFFRMENEYIFWDSTAYSDGSWESIQMNKIKRTLTANYSDEIKITAIYDYKNRLLSSININKEGIIFYTEKYIWGKNGRLEKSIINGTERKFVYGKSISDTVKVIPTDKYLHFIHSGYDGTSELIPEEGDSDYWLFAISPYFFFREKSKNEALYILQKSGDYNRILNEENNMPKVEYINIEKNEFDNTLTDIRFPYSKGGPYYGVSYAEPSFDFICEEIELDGCTKYKIKHSDLAFKESIKIVQSGWVYNDTTKKWEHRCWTQEEIEATYEHEITHIKRARFMIKHLHSRNISKKIFDTIKECQSKGFENIDILKKEWNMWSIGELAHLLPTSPRPTGIKEGVICNE